jgi:UDPglucose 6-dehydrogenase
MLAVRISFMNELANLAETLGADIEHVRQGIGADPRIGYGFLYAGCGYGGSCFPKDVKALIHAAQQAGRPLGVLGAVQAANERQKRVLVEKIVRRFGEDLGGRRFALWGLAFKPETDDMREAPSRVLVAELVRRGAEVRAYDPVAMGEAKKVFAGLQGISYSKQAMEAAQGADALVIATEWKEFRSPDFDNLKKQLKAPVIFDGRNLYDPAMMKKQGFTYYAIGRGEGVA